MFFAQIEKLCKQKGTTPTAVTLELGYSKGSMSHWKKGNSPSGEIITRFANYFGVTTDYLLKGENEVKNESVQYTQKIENVLKSKGITAKKMLLELGYADNLISQWKKGSEPSAMKLQRIADYLGLSMDYLLKGENEVENEKENEKMDRKEKNTGELRFAASPLWQKLKALRREHGLSIEELLTEIGEKNDFAPDYYRAAEQKIVLDDVSSNSFNSRMVKKVMEFFKNVESFKESEEKYLFEDEIKRTPFSKEIIRHRKLLGDTQEDLANTLQVETISVISWESSERIPNSRCMDELIAHLHLSDSEVATGTTNNKTGTDN